MMTMANHPDVRLVYIPGYESDANRIEWLWRTTRSVVLRAHRRAAIEDLRTDLVDHFADLADHLHGVLSHVSSPHAA